MRIKLENRTNKRKQFVSSAFQVHSAGHIPDQSFQRELRQEVDRRRAGHTRLDSFSVLEPHTTVTGWMVFALPWRSEPGEPDYTFTVRDELNHEYEATKP
jgi:hypothetical protein